MKPRPLIPPEYVNAKVSVLFLRDIPPAVIHTYCQLKALAWTNDGVTTPLFTFNLFEQLTGKSQSTLYGHLSILGSHRVLRYTNAGGGILEVTFTEDEIDSRYLESLVNDLSYSLITDEANMDESVPDSTNLERPEDKYKRSTEEALMRGLRRHIASGIDGLEYFPEDVREVLEAVCRLWMLHPPRKSGRKAGPYAYWIEAARDLVDACGEFGVDAIQAERDDFVKYMQTHKGLAPYRVEGPASLVKSVRAKAGEMRQKQNMTAEVTPPPAAVVWE